MVEFNKVSNESYFIKNLLYSTYLPLIRTVRENDFIIKNRLYIYKCNIIKCLSSGYIPIKNVNLNKDEAPESLLRKSDDTKVVPGQVYFVKTKNTFLKIVGSKTDNRNPAKLGWFEENIATFKILGEYYFGEQNGKFCNNFLSSSEGYDYRTHERLGFYLRALRDMYELNLMPLYNCFSNTPIRNIHITSDGVKQTSKEYYTKVFKVPIRFNTDYTICMNNIGMTTFAPAFIRHGTLLKLNNNRFGNNVDATNKYIKLNHNDVIHREPNLRFKNPIKLRFDNIPKNKKVHYSKYTYTELPAKYYSQFYRLNPSASIVYAKEYIDINNLQEGQEKPYRSIDYYVEGDKVKKRYNYQSGYKFNIIDPQSGIYPEDDLYPSDDTILPTPDGEFYESINPSIGTFDDIHKSYRECPEDETLFNKSIFDSNKTKYYTYDSSNEYYVQCNEFSIYDESTIYYYVERKGVEGWYEFVDDEFVPTEDTYIKPDKTYYRKEMTEVPNTYNYDITEENCCMYDYIEDDLYLLIEVPSTYEPNIVILEGDYTDLPKEKIYDDYKFEVFSNKKLDHLFTNNLILMETETSYIRPFSNTLMQFLLWNAICNLDTINNDMDRLADKLPMYNPLGTFRNNYWYSRYRQSVFDYAEEFERKYIRDNLGYVTRDIEQIIEKGTQDYEYIEGTTDFEEEDLV